jgi:hypothetical protein
MENRTCPRCFVKLPPGAVLARSEELVCPACHTELELSRGSRVLAALVGLCAGYAAASFGEIAFPSAAWVVAVALAVLAYGIASAVLLYVFSDVVVRPKAAAAAFPHAHG